MGDDQVYLDPFSIIGGMRPFCSRVGIMYVNGLEVGSLDVCQLGSLGE